MTRRQEDKQAAGKPHDVECGDGDDLDDSLLRTSSDGDDAAAANAESSSKDNAATAKKHNGNSKPKKADGDIAMKKDPKSDKERIAHHDGVQQR